MPGAALPGDLGIAEHLTVESRDDHKPVIAKAKLSTQPHRDEIVPPHSGVEAPDPETVGDRRERQCSKVK